MKSLVLICVFVLQFAEAQAPLPGWVSGTKTATSGWFDTTIVATAAKQYVNGFVYNAGTDTIWIARNKDTVITKYIAVRPGYSQPIYSTFQLLRVKARTNGTKYQYVFQ